jgi:hypothetical protein
MMPDHAKATCEQKEKFVAASLKKKWRIFFLLLRLKKLRNFLGSTNKKGNKSFQESFW